MFSLPKSARERLAAEFRFAADGVAAVSDFSRKAYFYSAFFGEVNRVMNWWWSPHLALLHTVLRASHAEIKGRLDQALIGGEANVELPTEFPAHLASVTNDLAALFEGEEPIQEIDLYHLLARVSELSYVLTGNGQYLYLKGLIKLDASLDDPAQPSPRSRGGARRKASRP